MAAAVASTNGLTAPALAAGSLRPARLTLVLVGLLFLLLQLILVPRPFGLSTDEATYLAKVDPSVPELYWTQPRAWGMPVLAAPIAAFSPSLEAIRLYFTVVSSGGLVTAFWPWLRVVHPAVAPVAALLFSTTWFTVFFGSLLLPNLYVGLGAVAAAGLYLRTVQEPRWWRVALVGTSAALVALVRPTDSVLVIAPLVVCALAVPRLRRVDVLAALAVGVVLGWLPWVVESYARFGGPMERLRAAEGAGPGGLTLNLSNLQIYPRLLDGVPTYCCDGGSLAAAGPMPLLLTGWLVAIPVAAVLGVAFAARQCRLPEMLLVVLPAGLLAAFYLLLPSFTTLRFLLPAFALLSLPVAAALVYVPVASARTRRKAAAVLIAAALVGQVVLMLPTAARVLDSEAIERARQIQTAAALDPLVNGQPCLLVATEPQVTGFYLGCRVQQAGPTRRPPARVREAQAEGRVVVALLRRRPALGSYLASWQRVRPPELPRGLRAYTPPR